MSFKPWVVTKATSHIGYCATNISTNNLKSGLEI